MIDCEVLTLPMGFWHAVADSRAHHLTKNRTYLYKNWHTNRYLAMHSFAIASFVLRLWILCLEWSHNDEVYGLICFFASSLVKSRLFTVLQSIQWLHSNTNLIISRDIVASLFQSHTVKKSSVGNWYLLNIMTKVTHIFNDQLVVLYLDVWPMKL